MSGKVVEAGGPELAKVPDTRNTIAQNTLATPAMQTPPERLSLKRLSLKRDDTPFIVLTETKFKEYHHA